MGIFESKEEKERKRREEKERVEKFMNNLRTKLDTVEPEQAKKDLKVLVEALVGFFGQENPKLFTPGKEEMWYVKQFFTTVVNVGTGAMMPGSDMNEKVKGFMNLFPVIQRYANVD